MRCSPSQWRRTSIQVLFVCIVVFSFATLAMSQAQSNAADLQGVVRDPKGEIRNGRPHTGIGRELPNKENAATADNPSSADLAQAPS